MNIRPVIRFLSSSENFQFSVLVSGSKLTLDIRFTKGTPFVESVEPGGVPDGGGDEGVGGLLHFFNIKWYTLVAFRRIDIEQTTNERFSI